MALERIKHKNNIAEVSVFLTGKPIFGQLDIISDLQINFTNSGMG